MKFDRTKYQREYYQRTRKARIEYQVRYYQKKRTERSEYSRKWREKNRELSRQAARDWVALNPERASANNTLVYARTKIRKHFNDPRLRFRDLPGFGK